MSIKQIVIVILTNLNCDYYFSVAIELESGEHLTMYAYN